MVLGGPLILTRGYVGQSDLGQAIGHVYTAELVTIQYARLIRSLTVSLIYC